MSVQHLPIVTPLGQLRGRDCIYLDDVESNEVECSVTLHGEISGPLVEIDPCDEFIGFSLTFHGVSYFAQTALDESDCDWDSSFEERLGTELLWKARGNEALRHFFVQTYDDVFDVLCTSYLLSLETANDSSRGKV